MKTGRLSETEREQIVALAEKNLGPSQIAVRLDRHKGTINFAMHALGLKSPKLERKRAYFRNGREVRSFTRDEDAWITALRVQGYPISKIAELASKRWGHPRTPATIGIRLMMLANLEEAI